MIGIFDSGVGGFTVLKELQAVFPSADILYFGDTKNAPYGERSREELSRLTAAGLALLEARGATSIISACNSVSASLALSLLDVLATPQERIIEMVAPTVRALRGTSGRLALAATRATIDSGLYQNAFAMIGKGIETIAIPELAGAIEQGATRDEIDFIVRDAFQKPPAADALILACTHFPLVADSFRRTLPGIPLFDPAAAVAAAAREKFWPREAGNGKTRFLISQDSPVFRELAANLFPESEHAVEVIQ